MFGLKRGAVRIIFSSFYWSFAPHMLKIFLILSIASLGSIFRLCLGYYLKNASGADFSEFRENLQNIVLVTAAFGAAQIIITGLVKNVYLARIGRKISSAIKISLFSQILSFPQDYFESARSGDVVSRIVNDSLVFEEIVPAMVGAIENVISLIIGMGFLIFFNLKLTFVIIFIMPVLSFPVIFFGKSIRWKSRDLQESAADVVACVEETIFGIRDIQAFGCEPLQKTLFENKVQVLNQRKNDLTIAMSKMTATSLLLIAITSAFLSFFLLLYKGDDHFSGINIVVFTYYSMIVAASASSLAQIWGGIQRFLGVAENLAELSKNRNFVGNIKNIKPPIRIKYPFSGAISFNDLSFRYPSTPDTMTLRDINLKIEPGEVVAFVGPSGAGKTTLFKLLMGFYHSHEGNLCLDEVDTRLIELSDIRHVIGLVPQDPVIFSTNAWGNIRCGKQDVSNEEVLKVAAEANCLEFLENLPNGLDTYLGEKGVRLSGGQRQRIAIARAMLRKPAILLLDEATSALDVESESKVQRALAKIMEKRTTLVIAHRLATVRDADRIVVMDKGQILACGSHEHLLQKNELYSRLVSRQFFENNRSTKNVDFTEKLCSGKRIGFPPGV